MLSALRQRVSRRPMLWMWLACAAICVALLATKAVLTFHLNSVTKQDDEQQAAAERMGDELLALRGLKFEIVRNKLAPRILDRRPTEWPTGMAAYHFVEPAAGLEYTLYFRGSLMHVYADRVTPPLMSRINPAYYRIFGTLRWYVTVAGVVLWILLLVALIGVWDWRRRLAQAMLAASLVVALALAISDYAGIMFTSQGRIYIGATLAAISLIFILLPNRHRRVLLKPHPRCASCGYDLTGNESGICPECGRTVSAKRFVALAERIESVADDAPASENDLITV